MSLVLRKRGEKDPQKLTIHFLKMVKQSMALEL